MNNDESDILCKIYQDVESQIRRDREKLKNEFRKKLLEDSLDRAIENHKHLGAVSSSERRTMLNQLDPDIFPL